MDEEYKPIHDTIDLEEIRALLRSHEPQHQKQPSPAAEPVQPSPAEPKPEPEQKPVRQEAETPAPQRQKPADKAEKSDKVEKKSDPLYECYGILHDISYILAVVTLLFVFVVRLVGVDGSSMRPTLHHGDYLVLESNFFYGPEDIETGDIVVLTVPYYKDEPIVKRVIATGGQTVDIDFENHVVYVDGVALEESYLMDYTGEASWVNWDGEYGLTYPATVPEGCIFVLGDNRNNSTDSRFAPVGMVDVRCVLGKVWAIVLPGEKRDAQGNVIEPREWNRIGLVS